MWQFQDGESLFIYSLYIVYRERVWKFPILFQRLPEKLHKIEIRNHIVRKNCLTVEEIENIRYYYEKIKAPTMYFSISVWKPFIKLIGTQDTDYNRIVSHSADAIDFHYPRSHLQTINLNTPTLKRRYIGHQLLACFPITRPIIFTWTIYSKFRGPHKCTPIGIAVIWYARVQQSNTRILR